MVKILKNKQSSYFPTLKNIFMAVENGKTRVPWPGSEVPPDQTPVCSASFYPSYALEMIALDSSNGKSILIIYNLFFSC